jgi:hypothetical protein
MMNSGPFLFWSAAREGAAFTIRNLCAKLTRDAPIFSAYRVFRLR